MLSDDFIKLIIHISALRIIQKRIIIDQIRQDILKLLKGLKTPIESNKPTFTYVHIVAPHSPFVFNADGSRPKYFESSFGKFEDKTKFLNQVKFVGKEMIEIGDSLLINDPNLIPRVYAVSTDKLLLTIPLMSYSLKISLSKSLKLNALLSSNANMLPTAIL